MSDFDFKNVSDSLYSSFIARDFFAKVLPGSIVLVAIALSFLNYDTLTQKVKDLPLVFGLLLYGLAWIVGPPVTGTHADDALHDAYSRTVSRVARLARPSVAQILPRLPFRVGESLREVLARQHCKDG